MLVPERIEPRHRARLDVRHGEDVAEIVWAEERPVGDEPVEQASRRRKQRLHILPDRT